MSTWLSDPIVYGLAHSVPIEAKLGEGFLENMDLEYNA
jgi:hypothetical protein